MAGGGWLPYRFAPLALNWFWTVLLPIDVAIVVLLWTRTAAGAWLGVAIMLADVGVNSWVLHSVGMEGLPVAVQLQTLFLGVVLGSTTLLLRRNDDGVPSSGAA